MTNVEIQGPSEALKAADASGPARVTRWGFGLLGLTAAAVLSGCAAPAKVAERERLEIALTDLNQIAQSQRPISAPIDMYDAMARALKYNLDRRIRNVEAFYAAGEFDLAKYKLLPQGDVGYGYVGRSNEQSSTSQNNPDSSSVSTEKSRTTGDAQAVWSTLDFGVSYLKMQQAGNQALIAEEATRKVTNRILADTRRAYWRAAAADQIGPLLGPIANSANAAIRSARAARERGDMTPEEANSYERQMLSTLRELERRQELLALSRAELASLVNVDPATRFNVKTARGMAAPAVPGDISTLRTVALMFRPELYEHDYKARIAKLQRNVEIMSTLPGIRLSGGYNYDSNKYLVNNDWFDVGARLSLQINQLVTLKARLKQAEAQALLVDTQRKAMTLSVVTQVHLSTRSYAAKRREFELAARMLKSDSDRLATVRASKEATAAGEAQLVEARAAHAMAQLDYYFTYAELQEAYATILTSLGVDTVPPAVEDGSLETLSTALRGFFENGLEARLRGRMAEARTAHALILKVGFKGEIPAEPGVAPVVGGVSATPAPPTAAPQRPAAPSNDPQSPIAPKSSPRPTAAAPAAIPTQTAAFEPLALRREANFDERRTLMAYQSANGASVSQ